MLVSRPARLFHRIANQRRIPLSGQTLSFRSFSITAQSSAQGYGDGKGDPKGETPQRQGSSSEATHNAEHPGPDPPVEGHNTGGATKTASGSRSEIKHPSESSANSGGSRSKEAKETGSSPTGGEVGGGSGESKSPTSGGPPRPKISDMKTPNEGGPDKQAEVEQHNKEFEQRYDRAPPAQEDKVDKKFWSGHGGAGKQP